MQNISETLARNQATSLKMNSFTGIFKDSIILVLTYVQCVPKCSGCIYVRTYNTPVSHTLAPLIKSMSLTITAISIKNPTVSLVKPVVEIRNYYWLVILLDIIWGFLQHSCGSPVKLQKLWLGSMGKIPSSSRDLVAVIVAKVFLKIILFWLGVTSNKQRS